jgi:hypothetical protein
MAGIPSPSPSISAGPSTFAGLPPRLSTRAGRPPESPIPFAGNTCQPPPSSTPFNGDNNVKQSLGRLLNGRNRYRDVDDLAVARRTEKTGRIRRSTQLEVSQGEAPPKANIRLLDAGPSQQETMALERNQDRIDKADNCDRATLLSKYLPPSAELFLPPPVEGPEDLFCSPPEFLARLTEVANMKVPTPKASLVEFATDKASLENN